jgi:hypothetical protein
MRKDTENQKIAAQTARQQIMAYVQSCMFAISVLPWQDLSLAMYNTLQHRYAVVYNAVDWLPLDK